MQKDWFLSLKKCAVSVALSVSLLSGVPGLEWLSPAHASTPALPDVSVLISGPPIKDPGALLRYALPIDNKAIREVQKPLEDITDSLKVAGVKALDSVERVRCHLLCCSRFIIFWHESAPYIAFWICNGGSYFNCVEYKTGIPSSQARENLDCFRTCKVKG